MGNQPNVDNWNSFSQYYQINETSKGDIVKLKALGKNCVDINLLPKKKKL